MVANPVIEYDDGLEAWRTDKRTKLPHLRDKHVVIPKIIRLGLRSNASGGALEVVGGRITDDD